MSLSFSGLTFTPLFTEVTVSVWIGGQIRQRIRVSKNDYSSFGNLKDYFVGTCLAYVLIICRGTYGPHIHDCDWAGWYHFLATWGNMAKLLTYLPPAPAIVWRDRKAWYLCGTCTFSSKCKWTIL